MFLLFSLRIEASQLQVVGDMVEIENSSEAIVMYFSSNTNITGENFFLRGNRIRIFIDNTVRSTAKDFSISAIREIHTMDNATFE
jgi:hypothetical protein